MSSYRRRLLLANQLEENLYLYGNSVQDGTPTPEAPVEIKSVENPIIKVDGEKIITINQNTPFGKNLLKPEKFTTVVKECITFNSIGDGSIIVNGTPNSTLSLNLKSEEELENLLIDGEKHTLALNPSLKNMSIALMIQRRNKSSNAISYISAYRYNSYTVTEQIDKSKYRYQALYLQITITDPVQAYENIVVKPILVKGSYTNLPFEQYIHPITTMRGIGEYKDKIYTKEGKVWFEQNIFHIKPTSFSRINSNRGVIQNLHHPKDYLKNNEKISNFGNYKSAWEFQDYIIWYLAKTDSKTSQIWMVPSKEYCDLWTTKEEAWKHLTKTLGIYPEFQYVLETPILTEITGTLAEQILAIDKTKNITITSENGVSGSAEVIVE